MPKKFKIQPGDVVFLTFQKSKVWNNKGVPFHVDRDSFTAVVVNVITRGASWLGTSVTFITEINGVAGEYNCECRQLTKIQPLSFDKGIIRE